MKMLKQPSTEHGKVKCRLSLRFEVLDYLVFSCCTAVLQ